MADSDVVVTSDGSYIVDIDHNSTETDRIFRVTKDNQATELLRVQEDGRVGIGTTPASGIYLDIGPSNAGGNTGVVVRNLDNGSGSKTRLILGYGSGAGGAGKTWLGLARGGGDEWAIGLAGSTPNILHFSYNDEPGSADKMVINGSNGNVGIGTTNPGTKLDLGTGTGAKLTLFEDGNTDKKSGLGINMSVGSSYEHNIYFPSDSGGHLAIGKYDGSTFTERLRIKENGDVGIGLYDFSDVTARLTIQQRVDTNVGGILIYNYQGNSSTRLWTDVNSNVRLDGASDASQEILLNGAGTGKVGIGTTSPTAMLDVNSDIIRLSTSKTPATSGASGNQGDICWDSNYIYVCVASNTWKRVAISTW